MRPRPLRRRGNAVDVEAAVEGFAPKGFSGLRSWLPQTLERYPITLADFLIADVTDSMLDGYIGGFPNTYASKVGKVLSLRDIWLALRVSGAGYGCRPATLCTKVGPFV